ncbi:MAG: ion transporter [Planctomycetota bacterium]|nr:ion transporter [Planctomycetota bacterium]
MTPPRTHLTPWQNAIHEVIFEADTPIGKVFDIVLLVAIMLSVLAVCLESVEAIDQQFGDALYIIEWVFTIAFTIEYVLRLLCVRRPVRYAVSFFGIVDLLAILPTYMSLIFVGSQSLLVIRALRLLRIFRVFKLAQFLGEADMLQTAVRASIRKLIIFMGVVLTLVLILGSIMYLVETPEAGFTSIPQSIYWAIVTMTTVGYGDIAPQSVGGQFLASIVMLTGYAIIAVPTGIVTVEMSRATQKKITTQACPSCMTHGHDEDAKFCKHCGASME